MPRANGCTRQEILTAIKMRGSMTADALAKTLGISPVAVRQHLAGLRAEGSISTAVQRRSIGRPVHVYTLTREGDEGFPRAYREFAVTVLEEVRSAHGEAGVDAVFDRRRDRLRAVCAARLTGKCLRLKVEELARVQTESGYMATVTECDGGLLLTEHNCAICGIARAFPAACAGELRLFQELLAGSATVERVEHQVSGGHTCAYRIVPTEAAGDTG